IPALALGWVTVPGGQADYRPGATFAYFVSTALALVLWSAGWAGARALRRARQAELARLKAEAERQGMELQLLRARLNPHFVFNALNNLRALIQDRKSTRLNSSHVKISYAVFCLKKKTNRTSR